jgi:hypothetical protein
LAIIIFIKYIYKMLAINFKACKYRYLEKAKPAARWGRKATGLVKEEKIAGLPGRRQSGFFYFGAGVSRNSNRRVELCLKRAFF